jgi:hypothetical protein
MGTLGRCLAFATLLAGCASPQYGARPFFLHEQDLESHGRKTWFDQLVETDPGGADSEVAADYQENPPRRIAVLPFSDRGNGEYLVNKLPILIRSEDERNVWSWTYSNRLRRAVTGALAGREFSIVPLPAVDAVLAARGILDRDKLSQVPVETLGRWLGADAVVYGELVNYEAYYFLLVAGWQISTRIRMVSTLDGHEFFSSADRRYSITVSVATNGTDIGVNSVLNLLMFRDVTLARTEYEVGREIVLRLPIAEHNLVEFHSVAREALGDLDPDAAPEHEF